MHVLIVLNVRDEIETKYMYPSIVFLSIHVLIIKLDDFR